MLIIGARVSGANNSPYLTTKFRSLVRDRERGEHYCLSVISKQITAWVNSPYRARKRESSAKLMKEVGNVSDTCQLHLIFDLTLSDDEMRG